jgi:hydroxyacylglutathione hydrolase
VTTPIPCLEDNYAYLIERGGRRAVVDPSEAKPVLAALGGQSLQEVWVTHHHWDHVGGIPALLEAFPDLIVRGADRQQVTMITHPVEDGFDFAGTRVKVLRTPGHTLDAVTYVMGGVAFTGDTFFSAGCGRLFEGTPEMLHASLQTIGGFPDDTRIFSGHEYFLSNLAFAAANGLDVEAPRNRAKARRAEGLPTVPTTLGEERQTNVFLRAPSAEVFARLRAAKDHFNG